MIWKILDAIPWQAKLVLWLWVLWTFKYIALWIAAVYVVWCVLKCFWLYIDNSEDG